MDKSDIFTAELILIFSLVIHLTSLNVPHFRNSNAYNSIIYERKHKVCVFIFLVRTLGTMRSGVGGGEGNYLYLT